jgi:hypothetical protein
VAPVAAAKKPPVPVVGAKPCDIYGPGYEPVGDTGVCLKISGYIEFGVDASFGGRGRHSSGAAASDWIKTKPAKTDN